MALERHRLPRVLVDSDVLFAAVASSSEHGASLLVLRLAELTLIQAVAPQQVFVETERNLQDKLPKHVKTFYTLAGRSLMLMPDPSVESVQQYQGKAHPKDLPILVSALENECSWLVTFNLKDYRPGLPGVKVLRPGDFVLLIRQQLTELVNPEA